MDTPNPALDSAEAAYEAQSSDGAAEAAHEESNTSETSGTQARAGTFGNTGRTHDEIWQSGTQEEIIALANAYAHGEVPESAGYEAETQETAEGDGTEGGESETEESGAEGADETVAGEQPGKLPRRMKPAGSAEDRARLFAVNDLMREEGLSLGEAIQRLGYAPAAAKAADGQPEAQTPEQPARPKTDPVLEKRAALKSLIKARAEAQGAYDFETAGEIELEIHDATRALAKAEAAHEQRADAKLAADDRAVKEVVAAIPALANPRSPLARAAFEFQQLMDRTNPTFFDNPAWTRTVAAVAWAQVHPGGEPMPPISGRAASAAVPKRVQPQQRPPNKIGASAASMLSGSGSQRGADPQSLSRVFNDPNASQADLIAAANALDAAEKRRGR